MAALGIILIVLFATVSSGLLFWLIMTRWSAPIVVPWGILAASVSPTLAHQVE